MAMWPCSPGNLFLHTSIASEAKVDADLTSDLNPNSSFNFLTCAFASSSSSLEALYIAYHNYILYYFKSQKMVFYYLVTSTVGNFQSYFFSAFTSFFAIFTISSTARSGDIIRMPPANVNTHA